jgi:hypothetical protein
LSSALRQALPSLLNYLHKIQPQAGLPVDLADLAAVVQISIRHKCGNE